MNDWNTIHSTHRIGVENRTTNSRDPRSEYQRDIDRIIFSPSFRRLQNKTQVFPLPGSALVHNRLTHSLEVSSVGRSLATLVGDYIYQSFDLNPDSSRFYSHELSNVVSAACLCHDIGNPAFGHSGERAISNFFVKNELELKSLFTREEWADLTNFEGNANAIRLLTHKHRGKAPGGFRLTACTLAAIAKYPCESVASDKESNLVHRKKYGFFQTERQLFKEVGLATNMIIENESPLIYRRHPFVYLVEAADDICYNIMDLEDAQKLRIISFDACVDRLLNLINAINPDKCETMSKISSFIADKNEQVSFLRAKAINGLINRSRQVFSANAADILSGSLDVSLMELISADINAMEEIKEFSYTNIYEHEKVIEIEIAGFNVMYVLLEHFIPTVLENYHLTRKTMIHKLIPEQFRPSEDETIYERVMRILDFVSGMTDLYATELYRKITGIEISPL